MAARRGREKVKLAAVYWQKILVCLYLKNASTAVCSEDYLQGYAYATGFERQHEPGMANRGRALPIEYFATHWGHPRIVMDGPVKPTPVRFVFTSIGIPSVCHSVAF
ncbi:MAG: hypothetical protein ACLPX9_19070, partial [Rhodomicrobium sp.]